MKFMKSDDQTLSTIARLATVEPELAKEFALKSKFYDETVRDETVLFWNKIERGMTPQDLAAAICSDSTDSNMIDKLRSELRVSCQ
ncbi:hypothetical protein RH728_003933 [Vibrio vulnificus]|nr:hypothetical protein [Vibrio vulnificus]EKA6052042.1 hypothetical protein [Vibrio vulnificus]ELB7645757.1 hypothetical protein [Vibrio vulnificus]